MFMTFRDRPWWAAEFGAAKPWSLPLPPHVSAEVVQALDALDHGRPLPPVPSIARLLVRVARELDEGLGFVLIRGVPVTGRSDESLMRLVATLGSFLGTLRPQTRQAELVSRVEDSHGRPAGDEIVRGHQTSDALPFHSDRADVTALLCVRSAANGGAGQVASAAAAFHDLARSNPGALAELLRPLPHDRRDEQLPDQAPWILLPVFSIVSDRLVARYVRRFIESASRFSDAPQLEATQRAALDTLDALLDRPGFAAAVDWSPGDLQFVNNHTVWHARSAFVEGENAVRRLLLRAWIAPPWSRALPESFAPLFGDTRPGVLRGGVQCDSQPRSFEDTLSPSRKASPRVSKGAGRGSNGEGATEDSAI